ncbi:MAG: choice-of-anchor D domain-containing protein, partial [Bacteroidales bacterium]|nr:choice-of-anchor D domain-containing protein [Bacteroidales bacterium]
MKKIFLLCFAIIFSLIAKGQVTIAENLLENSTVSYSGFSPQRLIGQTFYTGSFQGYLSSIQLYFPSGTNFGLLTLYLYEGDATAAEGTDPVAISNTANYTYPSYQTRYFTCTPLKPNTYYTFVMKTGGLNVFNVACQNTDVYTDGVAVQAESHLPLSSIELTGKDIYFQAIGTPSTLPEINLTGNGVTIPDGNSIYTTTDNTDFGTAECSQISKTFQIENSGIGDLTVSNITLSGTGASYFSFSGITFPITISPGSSTNLTIVFDSGTNGTHNATVNITSDDCNESLYNFNIKAVKSSDVTAPVPDIATLSDVVAECEVTSLTAPTATDNCSGTVTVTHNATLPITAQGTTVVTWTYDDGNVNTSTQTQNVIIDDVTNPVIPTLATLTDECSVTATAPTT